MARAGFLGPQPAGGAGRPGVRRAPPAGTPLPVLPNVARFLVERSSPDPDHWNLGVLLQRETRLDPELMRKVVERLIERHDALRLRFLKGSNGWASSIAPATDPLPFSDHDLSQTCRSRSSAPPSSSTPASCSEAFTSSGGPCSGSRCSTWANNGQRLLVIIHHFAMDGLSWRPFWEDFEAIYAAV